MSDRVNVDRVVQMVRPLRIKGTVSPGIAFYFRFCKIKSLFSVRPLIVFNFCYFLVL